MEYAKKIYNQFGARKLAIIGGSGLAAIIAVGLLAASATGGEDKTFLYTDLDPESAQQISEKLRGQGVDFTLSPDGTAIQVPVSKAPELRMEFAGQQLGGKIGYDILDNEEPFGTSAARAKLNETRAIEGELIKSIKSLDRIRDARVHIVMPERQLFATESRPASAAITVKTSGRISGQQTDAIRYLVAAAVPELSPDQISIVDQNGTLLARAGDGSVSSGALDERKQAIENKMRLDIERMLEGIVGAGHVRAQVAVALNQEQTKEESSLYDPDRQVVAKQTSVETSDQSNERSSDGGVSVATQLPENQGMNNAQPGDENQRSATEVSEEIVYQNSKVTKTSINPGGTVRRLTVSVLVDGIYTPSDSGAPTYKPQPQEVIERLQRVVENAVGFDQTRGDSVIVESMQFKDAGEFAEGGEGMARSFDWAKYIPHVLLALLALAAMFFVYRNMRSSRQQVETVEGEVIDPPLLDASSIDAAALTPEMQALLAKAAEGDEAAMKDFTDLYNAGQPMALDQEIDVAQVNGRLKANVLRRVGEVISENTPEAASTIRGWMNA